jgi:hypothetical protein
MRVRRVRHPRGGLSKFASEHINSGKLAYSRAVSPGE